MRFASLHRYVLLLVCCTFVLIVEGALTTSKAGLLYKTGHRHLATALAVGIGVLAIWTFRAGAPTYLKVLAAWSLLAFAPVAPIPHAVLAQLVFSTLITILLITSKSWQQPADMVEDAASPSLRSVTMAVPIVMIAQIALGAAFRHGALGGIPHITGAMLSLCAALLAGIFTLSQHSAHISLRNGAFALLSLTLIQIFLGLGAYLAKATDATSPSTIALTVAHVAMGTLTFASSIYLALQVRRNVRRITIVRVTSSSAAATS
jgi:heme A synthase